MNKELFIFLSNGNYLGFINNGYLYSRDGQYLGWLEGDFVWDSSGRFRGALIDVNNNKYVVINTLAVQPLPRVPRANPMGQTVLPPPPPNVSPIALPVGFKDGYTL
jgi:hypothetical protein